MRLVVARCTVNYVGRLESTLPEATRLIMVKEDGCVAIHADGGAYKPLNWMNAPNDVRESADRWEISNPKGERLIIVLHEILSDTQHTLGDDPGLSPTAIGPVDLLCRAADGSTVAIEVKRRGEIDGVEQLARYLEYLRADSSLGVLRGVFVAQSIKPQARTLAETRGLAWKEVDYDELRGKRVDELRLF
ncbi:MAG: DUF91 domain-containing protein [Actinobacteria bacterium]|nr:DUF91 domain-containing protein [Actinomycetota bacterium]